MKEKEGEKNKSSIPQFTPANGQCLEARSPEHVGGKGLIESASPTFPGTSAGSQSESELLGSNRAPRECWHHRPAPPLPFQVMSAVIPGASDFLFH